MKNYFENEYGHIVPFDKSGCVLVNKESIEVHNTLESDSFMRVDKEQLEDYKQWLNLQYRKDLEIAGLNKPIVCIMDNNSSNHIEDKLGMVKTKMIIEEIIKSYTDVMCKSCKNEYNECNEKWK